MAITHANKQASGKRITLDAARANRAKPDFTKVAPAPKFLGTRVFDNYDLAELARYIDWTPFFRPGNSPGLIPPFSRTQRSARPPAICSPTPRRC